MKRFTFFLALGALAAQTSWAAATTFTLKASVSGQDFDWSLGSNYEGKPAAGPTEGDKIVIPSGVTAIANAAAAAKLGTCYVCDIEVQSGGTFQVYDDGGTKGRCLTYVRTLTGEGTVTAPRSVAQDLYIRQSCRFDGILSGKVNFRIGPGIRFELTRADHSCLGAPIHESGAGTTYVINRFSPATGSGSTPGSSSFNLNVGSVVEYVGAEGLAETVEPSLWGLRDFVFDAGAYGGLTFKPKVDGSTKQRYLVVTGSNTVASVVCPVMSAADTGPMALAKEGSGTWVLAAASSRDAAMTGAIAVRDGTLKYENFAPAGTLCALGLSTNLNRFAFLNSITASDAIPYAILFDGPAEKVGFLESTYVGGDVVTNYDRKIGLETSGGFRSAAGRLAFAVETTSAAGEKLLVLDGAEDHNDTLSGVGDGAAGRVSVEKRGAGAWTLRPPFGFTGKLAVKAGRLDLFNGGDRFNWYRLRIKENAFANDGELGVIATNYYATMVGEVTPAAKRSQQLAKWILLDENGVVRNDFSEWITVSGAYLSAQPTNAYPICCRPMEMATPNAAFDLAGVRPLTALCSIYNNWFNQSAPKLLDVDDESTWPTLVLRLADDVPEIKYCDFLSSLPFPSDYCGRLPTALRVEASCDGLAWTTVFDRNDMRPPTAAGSWYSGAATGGRSTLTFTDASSRFALSPTKPVAQPAIALDATVSVAAGATLRCRGAVTLSKIELLADGMGAISGDAALAETGMFVVSELAAGETTKTFATTLKDLSGAANLANWQTSCDGLTSRYVPRYDPATGSVVVYRRGLSVIIR